MLQQTQVSKVIDYYNKFIHFFPTVQALANASLSDVLKAWEGMGYYARARNLHKAAQVVVKEFNGTFPNDLKSAHSLPGIGPYTAAAILSIAYGRDFAVLDGNVIRVLCRIFEISEDAKSKNGKEKLTKIANDLLAHNQAGTYNQAIMELGALVCTPVNPKCDSCPVSSFCQATKAGTQSFYPLKIKKKPRPHYIIAAGVIWRDNTIFIARRPENGLLGGLWEFPGGKVKENESLEEAVIREVKEETNLDVKIENLLTVINHQYSHFTITMHVYNCTYKASEPQALGCTDWRWVTRSEITDYAFPRANGKVLDLL